MKFKPLKQQHRIHLFISKFWFRVSIYQLVSCNRSNDSFRHKKIVHQTRGGGLFPQVPVAKCISAARECWGQPAALVTSAARREVIKPKNATANSARMSAARGHHSDARVLRAGVCATVCKVHGPSGTEVKCSAGRKKNYLQAEQSESRGVRYWSELNQIDIK